MHLPLEPQLYENNCIHQLKKIDHTRKHMEKGNQSAHNGGTGAKPYKGNEKEAKNSTSTELQFKYVTPIQDPSLVVKVAQKLLDVPITITMKELLSISPEVRKHVKEQINQKDGFVKFYSNIHQWKQRGSKDFKHEWREGEGIGASEGVRNFEDDRRDYRGSGGGSNCG